MDTKGHILVIDDDTGIRSLLQFYLGRYYDVTSQENGLEAMCWLEKGNYPDLILSDIIMPEIGGYEFLKLIRGSGFFQDIPVLILTGANEVGLKEKFYQEGAQGFMTKPFNPNALLKKIDSILNVNTFARVLSNADVQ